MFIKKIPFLSCFFQCRVEKQDRTLPLQPLTPKFLEVEHRCYVDELYKAIESSELLNIALSGNYGVGKSSILHQLATELGDRSIEVSLSTLAKEGFSKQGQSITNRIQQEIVKQLLYRHKVGKAKGSRFRKINRWSWSGEIALAALSGLILTLLFFITGWSSKIALEISTYIDVGKFDHAIIFLFLFLTSLFVRFISYGQIYVKELSTGSATVTLDDKSLSYFDQYLDEIVYFFEVYDYDVLIIEDIDRFDDSHIFETLKALNTTLNKSPSQKDRIKFIYAIKDSIFDYSKPKTDRSVIDTEVQVDKEVERANRTKFFDLIIPVVPFITHQNARNLVFQVLSHIDHQIDEALVDLVSRYIPDMRLLKNICNEFIVFRARLFSGDGERLNLNESELFAMTIYKNTQIADFEKIRFGSSNLDELYWHSRVFIRENNERLFHELSELTKKLDNLSRLSETSKKLGKKLRAYLSLAGQYSGRGQIEKSDSYYFDDERIKNQDFDTVKFWNSFLSSGENTPLEWSQTPHGRNIVLRVTSSEFLKIYGDEIHTTQWDEDERQNIKASLTKVNNQLGLLSNADMKDLIDNKLFEQSAERKNFETIAQEKLDNQLAFELVRAGYINRNFTLYTATFHATRLSAAATNFIIHHLNQGKVDINFKLDDSDVRALIREHGIDVLDKSPMLNLSVLNYVLSNESHFSNNNVEKFISKLDNFGADEKALIQTYVNQGLPIDKLLKKITPHLSKVFTFLVADLDVDHALRLKVMSFALKSINPEIKYETSEELRWFLSEQYESLGSLFDDSIDTRKAKAIAIIFDELNIKVKNLSLFSGGIRDEFLYKNLYQINKECLDYIFSEYSCLALDIMYEVDKTTYTYLIINCKEYLSVIESSSPSVESNDRFITILNDVTKIDSGDVDKLIYLSAGQCIVDDLDHVAVDAWNALAKHSRFVPTFHNIAMYIEHYGIDTYLAQMLMTIQNIKDVSNVSEESKQTLAITILNCQKINGSVDVRIRLVNSLFLEEYIPISEIKLEKGRLVVELLKNTHIEDSADTYKAIRGLDDETKELYIKESKAFSSYMKSVLSAADAALILNSAYIDSEIKMKLVTQADEYFYDANHDELHVLANFVLNHNMQISSDMISKVVQAEYDVDKVSELLESHLSTIQIDELAGILQLMGESYAELAYVGRERPKILDTKSNRHLLDALKKFDIVSKYEPDDGTLRVSKKHKAS